MGIGEIARTMNFVESIVEDAAVNDTLLPKLISGEPWVNVGGLYLKEAIW